jgi:hypothetical protein
MNTVLLTHEIKHPLRWIAAALLSVAIGFAAITLESTRPAWLFPHPPALPLEQALWTCDPGYQHFYGPGTPQSLALVRSIRNYLTPIPNFDEPVFLAPLIPGGSPDEIALFAPFTPQMVSAIRASHGKSVK